MLFQIRLICPVTMGRILAIDFGLKRTGLAVTDPLKIIASPLETVPTGRLLEWLQKYLQQEEVETIVLGMPVNLDGSDTHTTAPVKKLMERIKEKFREIHIEYEDERFTSKMAMDAMIAGGMKKKDRRQKSNVDKISASIILQSYLSKQNK